MMILTAFMAATFGKTGPIKMAASITFEQSYHEVDGDSASMAEFCALISSLAEIPIVQNLAITGSMNQFGEVQPVGGVNEKVEGFFETCCIKGLTGQQGVIIPQQNVVNLMLNKSVRQACKNREFSIYAVGSVSEAIELLMSVRAGITNAKGTYPKNTVYGQVQQKLKQLELEEKKRHR